MELLRCEKMIYHSMHTCCLSIYICSLSTVNIIIIFLIGTYRRHLLLSNQLLATVASAASRHSYATPTVFQARHTHTTPTWRLGRPLPHEEGAITVAEDEKVSGQLDDA